MKPTTDHPFREIVRTRFKDVLSVGKHDPDSVACVLEAASVARGVDWTDNPEVAGLPDLRPLNDAPWSSDAARTKALIPVVEALWDWPTWTDERRQAWAKNVVERTICEIVPIRTADLIAFEAIRCEQEGTTVRAAGAVARAAAWATGLDAVLILACRIWREEALSPSSALVAKT